eukprot:754937-Amphidinium_carterae.1
MEKVKAADLRRSEPSRRLLSMCRRKGCTTSWSRHLLMLGRTPQTIAWTNQEVEPAAVTAR